MSKAHINSTLQLKDVVVSTSDNTILLDHCISTYPDMIATNGQYVEQAYSESYPSGISPDGITITNEGPATCYNIISGCGASYKLKFSPCTIFMHFKMLSNSKTNSRTIFQLYDSSNLIYLKVYSQLTTGYLKIDVYNGTSISEGYISTDVTDGSWYTISVQINSRYRVSNTSDNKTGFTCRLKLCKCIDNKTVGTVQALVVASGNSPYPTPLSFPNTLMLGYSESQISGNIAVGEIRVESVEVDDDELNRWHSYGKPFYDPLDFNAFVY